jgi:hypothetical protein
MRNLSFVVTGLSVLLVIGVLCLRSGQADADDAAADDPHTFAHYANHVLHDGDLVTVRRDMAGGYCITLVPRDQFDAFRSDTTCETVKQVHSDYVVFRKVSSSNTFNKDIMVTVVPFHAITTIRGFTDEDKK